jgi:hypothetical protein
MSAMYEIMLMCGCGGTTRIPLGAMGQFLACKSCGAKLHVTRDNTRPLTQAELGVRPVEDATQERPESTSAAPRSEVPEFAPPPGHAADEASEVNLFLDHDQPAPAPTRAAPAAAEPARPAPAKAPLAVCARCGKPFRGDWDQVDTLFGVLCHICAHRAEYIEASAVPASSTPPPGPLLREISRQSSWSSADQQQQATLTDEDRRRRRFEMIVLAVIAAVVIGAVLLWPESNTPEKVQNPREISSDNVVKLGYSIMAIQAILGVLRNTLLLFVVLGAAKKLPNETFGKNLVALLLVGAVLSVARVFGAFGVSVFYLLPVVGTLAGAAALEIFLLYVLSRFHSLEFSDAILFVVCDVLSGILLRAVSALVFGVAGLVAFF